MIDADKIFGVTDNEFEGLALEIFRFQYDQTGIYRGFCDAMRIDPSMVTRPERIPFLPIQFFKSRQVISGPFEPGIIFESSGTTGAINSRHLVKDISLYDRSFRKAFEKFYGNPQQLCIIGLLPSYLERKHSSLVYMVDALIKSSLHPKSGFYLYDHEALFRVLTENEQAGQPTLLIGVTYALLDFAEQYSMSLQHTIIMETGGMKGRREELTRPEVHDRIQQSLGVKEVHSEYGMTELLSQAYSAGAGIFGCPPWMKVILRADDDPLQLILPGNIRQARAGAVNVIDLANLHSCSFIATDDIGKLYPGGRFEILGRLDNSDARGCGLMIA